MPLNDAVKEQFPHDPPTMWVVCECDGHAITVHEDALARERGDPPEQRFVMLGFWERDPSMANYGFRERIRNAWRWLRGRTVITGDVMLNERETKKLLTALHAAHGKTWGQEFWGPAKEEGDEREGEGGGGGS